MNFTVFDVAQRSDEWAALRAGLVTGSCAGAITAVRKRGSGELAVRRDLRRRLVCERLTRMPSERQFRQSEAMTHGIETEPDAIAAYEAHTGQIVSRVGFIRHNHLRVGCSPDGYVGNWEGVVEVKAPDSLTHLEYIEANVIPDEYAGQLIHSLWLTGAAWVDFVSFDPSFPGPLRLFIRRMKREDVDLKAYEPALMMFLSEVDRAFEVVAALTGEAAVA